jgi:hypothetical protein
MRKLILILFLGFTLVSFSQNTAITDPNFEQALIDLGIDTGTINGSVLTANISGVESLNVINKNIANLTGIEDFIALTYLNCGSNQLTSLDVSTNTALTTLYCDSNQLTSLDVSKNPALTYLNCYDNQLTSLDVSKNPALRYLYCHSNQLTSLDVSNNTALQYLYCNSNKLTSLDVSNNTALIFLACYSNPLTSLDVSTNTALQYLYCNSNQLTSLDVSKNTALTYLSCYDNQLTSLDVRNGNSTNFTNFDSTNNPNLTCIFVDDTSYSTTNWTGIDPNSTFVENEAECAGLSIEDNTFGLGVSVYPNPTGNYLFIEGNKNPIAISIHNLLGKKVMSAKNTNKIDVKELSSGVYIIRISDGIGQTNRKFVKK